MPDAPDTASDGTASGGMFRALRSRNYRLYFAGQGVSLVGTWIQRLALPWLVYRLTGSVALLGVVGFVSQLPIFILAPFAGVFVDRWDRYRMLAATQALAMVQAAVLAALTVTGAVAIWEILALGALLGVVNAFDMPLRQALVVDLVDRREDLPNAIALNSSMVNAARLVGPSIAGLLIAATGEAACFSVNAVSYLFVLASIARIRIAPRSTASTPGRTGLREGFSAAFGNPPIRALILLLALTSFAGMSYVVLMPVFAKETLRGGSTIFGFLMGAAGVGALCGALYLASRTSMRNLGRIVPLAVLLFGAGLIAFSRSHNVALSLPLMFLVGLGLTLQMAATNTIIQTIVDDGTRGRVMSFYTMAFIGTTPFGNLAAGAAAGVIGAPATVAIGGIACLIGAAAFARGSAAYRDLLEPGPARPSHAPAASA